MLWETIATLSAGLGAAGLMLALRLLWKTIPKSLLPIMAGLAMLGFQMMREYAWFEEQRLRLPKGVEVVATLESREWYRPWSYIRAPILQLAVVEQHSRGVGIMYVLTRHQKVEARLIEMDCGVLPSALVQQRIHKALCKALAL
ncbi:MAG: hypothetical protein Q4B71_03010 [Cardiobacteriaceae bacterium]|nr:hypothetical protein [Cardiobacteriaceae bacterium]